MNVKTKTPLSDVDDDDILNALCFVLELRGKADVARGLRAAYYRLATDADDRERAGEVLRTEPPPWKTSDDGGSQSPFPHHWDSLGDYSRSDSGVEKDDPDDVHQRTDR